MTILTVYPADGATNVSRLVQPEITFSANVNLDTFDTSLVILQGLSTTVPVEFEVEWRNTNSLLVIKPTMALLAQTTYSLKMNRRDYLTGNYIEDEDGNELTQDVYISFTTSATSAAPDGKDPSTDSMYSSDIMPDNPFIDMKLVGVFPMSSVLWGANPMVSLEFTDDIEEYDVTVEQTHVVTGEESEVTTTITVDNNVLRLSMEGLATNSYITIFINSVISDNGLQCEPTQIDFFTSMYPRIANIRTIHSKLGGLKTRVKESDAYLAYIDSLLRLEALTGKTIIGVAGSVLNAVERSYVRDRTMLNLLEMIFVEKDFRSGDAVMVSGNSLQYGASKSAMLEYYRDAVKNAEERISLANPSARTALRGKYVPKTFSRVWRTLA